MGARSEHEALGIFVHDRCNAAAPWGRQARACSGWRSWARVIRGRLPAIGRPNTEVLHHGPPPAYARGQAAVGGADRGRGCTPAGIVCLCGWGVCAPRRACERRAVAAGWQVALTAAKFARLWILDWTLVSLVFFFFFSSSAACRPLEVPPPPGQCLTEAATTPQAGRWTRPRTRARLAG